MPERIQRRRTENYRMPEGAKYVGRTRAQDGLGVYGNPFMCFWASHCPRNPDPEVQAWAAAEFPGGGCCVGFYREYVVSGIEGRDASTGTLKGALLGVTGYTHRDNLVRRLPDLTGRDLACFCRLGKPCHVDVLLEIVNDGGWLARIAERVRQMDEGA